MQPIEVDDITAALPAMIERYMPAEELGTEGELTNLAHEIFAEGRGKFGFSPKDGIDPEKACRHLGVVIDSFQYGHTRKIRAVGYLINEWFDVVVRYHDKSQSVDNCTVKWKREDA